MYGLPKGFDGSFFTGRVLELVSFSENTVFLSFGDNVSITVMSSLQHQLSGEDDKLNIQTVPLGDSRLMQLVGHCVLEATGDEDGTLTIVFSNGHVVKVFDDQTHYDSYLITDGEREIVV